MLPKASDGLHIPVRKRGSQWPDNHNLLHVPHLQACMQTKWLGGDHAPPAKLPAADAARALRAERLLSGSPSLSVSMQGAVLPRGVCGSGECKAAGRLLRGRSSSEMSETTRLPLL